MTALPSRWIHLLLLAGLALALLLLGASLVEIIRIEHRLDRGDRIVRSFELNLGQE